MTNLDIAKEIREQEFDRTGIYPDDAQIVMIILRRLTDEEKRRLVIPSSPMQDNSQKTK